MHFLCLAFLGILLFFLPGKVMAAEKAEQEEQEAVRLLNELREREGIAPLRWNPASRLQKAARIRVHELEHSFSHTRPHGEDCDSVLAEVGLGYRRTGENIAYGTRLTARGVISMWNNSPGHHANMLNPQFQEVGLASWHGRGNTVYWVQIFLTR